jgi:calmodulin
MKNNLQTKKAKAVKTLQSILEDPFKLRCLSKEIFQLVDSDGNEFIDLSEVYNYMIEISKVLNCSPPDLEDVKHIINSLDMDGDQKISIEEFEIYVREILEKMIENEYQSMNNKTKMAI